MHSHKVETFSLM